MNRRQFTLLSAGSALSCTGWARGTAGATRFFSIRREKGQPRLQAPDGSPFFSLGLNWVRPNPLGTQHDWREWKARYGRDARAWIDPVESSPLEAGRFNVSGLGDAGDGRAYCHLVPFSGAGRWNDRDQQCNYLGTDWEEWCDHVAREHCEARAAEQNLVGYFYSGSRRWSEDRAGREWCGPLQGVAMLKSRAGRQHLRALARRYYEVTHAAIRRYDPNHLILGDCHDGGRELPVEIYEEAVPRVDVLSFREGGHPLALVRRWNALTGMPVLLAGTERINLGRSEAGESSAELAWYQALVQGALREAGCIGIHLSARADSAARYPEAGGDHHPLRGFRTVNTDAELRLAIRG